MRPSVSNTSRNSSSPRRQTRRSKPAPVAAAAAEAARPPAADYDIEEHAALLELTNSLFVTLDLDGCIRACSTSWLECLHRSREELVGRPLFDLVEPADLGSCRTAVQRTLAGHPAEEISVRFRANGRGTVWLALRPRLNAARDAVHLVARDVTAQRVACDDPLRADLVLDELQEGVLIADATRPGLPILLANAGFARLTGYSPAEVQNRPLLFAADPASARSAFDTAFATALAGDRCDLEACFRRKDGAPVWMHLHLRPIADSSGRVHRIIAVHLDVTERRIVFDALRDKNLALTEALESLQKTKEAIVQRERMHALGKMASGIVHDFNNLLAPILGFTELLLSIPELLNDSEKVALYLQKIRTAASDGATVVARLREFYRSRNDAEPPSEFRVQTAVEEVLELTRHRWRNEAQGSGVAIEVVSELEETPPVVGSASEIRQVLTNLVLNGLDAMPKGGTLRLRTYPMGNWVCIQIADTGTGMSEEVRRRCFEPFFTTKGKAGTGLGLAIVFGIVERHHGRVDLRSEEGKGTTFTLWLPAGSAPAGAGGAPSVPEADGDNGRPMRVLVVDDEDLLLEVVSQQLLNMGHRVDCFTDPKAALEHFYKNPCDLVITDRAMPGMTGDQLACRIREFKPDTPVVLLTGFGNFIKQSGETPENIDEVLSKPLSQQTLRTVVARHGGRSTIAGSRG